MKSLISSYFLYRLGAGLLDCVIDLSIQIFAFAAIVWVSVFLAKCPSECLQALLVTMLFTSSALVLFVRALQESSFRQSTVGQSQFGFYVSDVGGKRLSMISAIRRNAFRLLVSPLNLLVVFASVGAPGTLITVVLVLLLLSLVESSLPNFQTGIPSDWSVLTSPGFVYGSHRKSRGLNSGAPAGYSNLSITTSRGQIKARLFEGVNSGRLAVIAVPGCGVGFGSPARGMYAKLGKSLMKDGDCLMWLSPRNPTDLFESICDIRAAVSFFKQKGYQRIALIGHSASSAGVVSAAAMEPSVASVIVMSGQNANCDLVRQLSPCSLLLIHGRSDRVIPIQCAEQLFAISSEPKTFVPVADGHGLSKSADNVFDVVRRQLRSA